jgi:hypothetical protein
MTNKKSFAWRMAVVALTAFVSGSSGVRAAEAIKPFQSFESEAEIADAKLNHAQAALVETGVSDGKKALRVTFQPPANYPSYSFPIAKPYDWTGFGGIAFEVTNPGAEPVSFALRIDSAPGSDGSKNSRTRSGRVEAGKTMTFLMPFDVDMESPDMSTLPGYTVMRGGGGWNPFNIKNIAAMQFFVVKPPADRVLIFDNLRLVPALPPVPQPPLKTETKALLSFETDAETASIKGNSASTRVVTQGATTGTKAIRMKFDPPATYPNVAFPFATPQDFRGYGGLAFDLTNPTKESVRFFVRVDSAASAGGTGEGARSGGATLEAGQTDSFVLPFGVDAKALGMASLPGFGSFRNLGAGGSGVFDLSKIATWQVFLVRPGSSQELIIDNVRVVPGQKQDFNDMIDRYGQYTRADWPGKIKNDADFQKQIATEDGDLKAHPSIAGFNKYGGWANGPQLKATGFFRVEKYNDKWSFIDPEGRLFLSFGPTTVSASQSTPYSGREYMFATKPESDELLAKYQGEKKDSLDFLGANLERKYGADYKQKFYDRTYQRLQSWGFNTVGAFSSWDTLKNDRVPYTATVWAMSGFNRVPLDKNAGATQSDPFDPRFANMVFGALRGQALRVKDDPYFIGYFVGNEENWGYWRNGPRSQYGLILGALRQVAANSPAKRAILAQLQEKYGDVAKLNAAWKTSFADWNAMNETVDLKDPLPAPMLEDFAVALKLYAAQYFRVIGEQIKKIDPNHLYLGCRFAGYSPEILEAAAQYSDVLSFNIYRLTVDSKEFAVLDAIDKPILVGEFHFGATDRGMFNGGLVSVVDQQARAKAYQNYVRSIVDNPKFVGAHWFQYTDQPTTGRGDGENANVGFVSITDTPYPELIAGARAAHAEMYPRRFGK